MNNQYPPKQSPQKNNYKILAIIFGIIIFCGVVDLIYDKYEAKQLERDIEFFNNGTAYAVISIVNQIKQTGYIEIPLGNQSIVLVEYQG